MLVLLPTVFLFPAAGTASIPPAAVEVGFHLLPIEALNRFPASPEPSPPQAAPAAKISLESVFGQGVSTTGASSGTVALSTAGVPSEAQAQRITRMHRPMAFEPNQGQFDPEVQYLARGGGYQLMLTATEAVIALHQADPAKEPGLKGHDRHRAVPSIPAEVTKQEPPALVRIGLEGAQAAQLTSEDELPGKVNYYLGDDPAQWRTNLPTYGKARYREVYPGVDLVYYGNDQQRLEYDFVVAPGADPTQIKLAIRGAERIVTDEHGDLLLHLAHGVVKMQKPVVYQEVNGERLPIAGDYVLLAEADPSAPSETRQVGFQVAAYDVEQPLVIDPVVAWGTYLGGSSYEYGFGIAADGSGNAYVTGYTSSTDFPHPNGVYPNLYGTQDAFVTKFSASGQVLWSTYLGGGTGIEQGNGIAVDGSGNAYVTGYTTSTDFPHPNGVYPNLYGSSGDAFVTKFNAGGQVLWSTYLGGTGGDSGTGIAVDGSGNAYVTGQTTSTDLPRPIGEYPNLNGG